MPINPNAYQRDHELAIVGTGSSGAGAVRAADRTRSRPHSDASPAADCASRRLEDPAAVVGRPDRLWTRLIMESSASASVAAAVTLPACPLPVAFCPCDSSTPSFRCLAIIGYKYKFFT